MKWLQSQSVQRKNNVGLKHKCIKKQLVYRKGAKGLDCQYKFIWNQSILFKKNNKKNRWHSLEIVFVQHHSGVVTKWKPFLLNILTEKSSKAERWWLVSNPRRQETARFTLKVQMKCIKIYTLNFKTNIYNSFSLLCVSSLSQSKNEKQILLCFRH